MNLMPALVISLAAPFAILPLFIVDFLVYSRLIRLFFVHRLWKGEVDPDDIIFDTFDTPVIKIGDNYGIAKRNGRVQLVNDRKRQPSVIYGPVYAGVNSVFFAPSAIIQKKIDTIYFPILDDIERMNNL